MLTNNTKQVAAHHNEILLKNAQQNSKKKVNNVQTLTEQDIINDYKYLPFHHSDVTKMFPVLKHLHFKNSDVKNLLGQGNAALKESQMDKAFELYSQANNLLL